MLLSRALLHQGTQYCTLNAKCRPFILSPVSTDRVVEESSSSDEGPNTDGEVDSDAPWWGRGEAKAGNGKDYGCEGAYSFIACRNMAFTLLSTYPLWPFGFCPRTYPFRDGALFILETPPTFAGGGTCLLLALAYWPLTKHPFRDEHRTKIPKSLRHLQLFGAPYVFSMYYIRRRWRGGQQ